MWLIGGCFAPTAKLLGGCGAFTILFLLVGVSFELDDGATAGVDLRAARVVYFDPTIVGWVGGGVGRIRWGGVSFHWFGGSGVDG